jgi:integral membrane protein (TIGR01906 family)
MLNKILKTLFIVSLIILIITLNFKLLSLNYDFYKKEFNKLNVYDKFPDADKHALNLINYYKDKEELSNFYNEKEKLHLKDVKDLIKKLSLIFYLSLVSTILLLIYFVYKKNYKIILNLILSSSITLVLLTLILFLFNFSNLFTNFHLILFNNDLWLFNQEDNLINLFPEKFFYDVSKEAFTNILIISLILIIISIIFKLNKKLLNSNLQLKRKKGVKNGR